MIVCQILCLAYRSVDCGINRHAWSEPPSARITERDHDDGCNFGNSRRWIAIYRCDAGGVHLVYQNVNIGMTCSEFLALNRSVQEVAARMECLMELEGAAGKSPG